MDPKANVNTTDISPVTTQGGMHIESPDGTIAQSQHIEGVTQDKPVEQNPDGGALGGDPRKSAMEAIIANRAREMDKELAYAATVELGAQPTEIIDNENPTEARQPRWERKPAAAPVEAEPATPSEEAAPEIAESAKTNRKLVVNGKEIPVSEDEIVKLAQMGMAANERFQQASAMRQEAERLAHAAMESNQRQQQAQQQQPQAVTIDDNKLRDVSKRFSFGSEEEQVKALRDLVEVAAQNGSRPTGPSPQEVVNFATQNALAQLRFEQNLAQVGNEYPDVFADKYTTQVAAMLVGDLRYKYHALGTPKSDMDIYREAGSMVRERYLNKAPVEANPAPEAKNNSVQSASAATSQSRVERKRAAPQPPVAASKIAHAPMNNQQVSGSDIVSRMRQARGQPV